MLPLRHCDPFFLNKAGFPYLETFTDISMSYICHLYTDYYVNSRYRGFVVEIISLSLSPEGNNDPDPDLNSNSRFFIVFFSVLPVCQGLHIFSTAYLSWNNQNPKLALMTN